MHRLYLRQGVGQIESESHPGKLPGKVEGSSAWLGETDWSAKPVRRDSIERFGRRDRYLVHESRPKVVKRKQALPQWGPWSPSSTLRNPRVAGLRQVAREADRKGRKEEKARPDGLGRNRQLRNRGVAGLRQ